MASKQLLKILASPSKVATALDWKKSIGASIATMDVHADRIGVTISRHPSTTASEPSDATTTSYSLPVEPKGLRKIPDSSRRQFSDLVRDHNVCGFVVSWPIQRDTGIMGAACGRTLFTIEELLSSPELQQQEQQQQQEQSMSQRPVFNPIRPVCFWDGVHTEQHEADVFGRSPVYARASDKKVHRASKEQYHQDESIVAVKVWEDFVRANWPKIYRQQQQQQRQSTEKSSQDRDYKHQEWGNDKKTVMAS